MLKNISFALVLFCSACTRESQPPPADLEPVEEAREFLISWITEIGAEEFISRGDGYDSFLPIDQWEIGIDGKYNEDERSFEFGVYYPYRVEGSGIIRMDLLGAVVSKASGEWKVLSLLY